MSPGGSQVKDTQSLFCSGLDNKHTFGGNSSGETICVVKFGENPPGVGSGVSALMNLGEPQVKAIHSPFFYGVNKGF